MGPVEAGQLEQQYVQPPGQAESLEELGWQIAKGGVIGFVGSGIGKVANFVLHVLLGRVLGPGAYGLYILGVSILIILQPLASLGLMKGILRFCAMFRGEKDTARVKGTLLAGMLISTLLSVLVGTILLIFSVPIANGLFGKPELAGVLRVFAIALPFYVLMMIAGAFAQSFRRIEYQQGVISIFQPVINLCVVGLAFLLGLRLYGALYGFLASVVVSAGLAIYSLLRIFPEILSAIRPRLDQVAALIRYSLPMIFVSISYLLALRTDRLMLGLLGKAEDVGIYGAGANIAIQTCMINAALVSIFAPVISDVYNRQQPLQVKQLYNLVKRWSSYGTFLLVLPVIFYSQVIMSIYGEEFIKGWTVLAILSGAYLLGPLTGPVSILLQMTGRQKVEFFNCSLMVTGNLTLNWVLIPVWGYLGAGIATLLVCLMMAAVRVVQVYRSFGFHPFDPEHLKFVMLVILGFLTGLIVSALALEPFKLVSLLFVVGLFLLNGYKTKTQDDKIIWMRISKGFAGGGAR